MNTPPVVANVVPLERQREALLARIHEKRGETIELAQRLAQDIRKTGHAQNYVRTGFSLLKSAVIAGGVIWSFKATAKAGFMSRFFTMAVSALSAVRTFRALGKVGEFFSPFSTSEQTRV
jgi:hypothetical protein